MIRYASDPEINNVIHQLVANARRLLRRQFAARLYPNLDFDELRWDFGRRQLSGRGERCALFYLIHGDAKRKRMAMNETNVLPAAFANVIKAWVVHSDMSPGYLVANVVSARYLWASLSTSKSGVAFRWDNLSVADFETAARYIESTYPKTAVHHQIAWNVLLTWIRENELVSDALEWSPSARRVRLTLSADRREERLDRLPRQDVLAILGQIYLTYAKSRIDRIVICAVGILFCTGFRIGELVTLPDVCWVTETVKGRERYGIRYWNQKTPDGHYKAATRWLSPLGAELAEKCINEIRSLTAEARTQARVLEQDPARVKIPGAERRVWLTKDETATAMSVKPWSLHVLVRSGYMKLTPYETSYRRWEFRRTEVEDELLRRRPPLYTLQIGPNRFQPLSQTLLLSFVYESDPQATTSKLLVQGLLDSTINTFLGVTSHGASAFDKFGFNEAFVVAGQDPLRLRTHAIRHWLNTVANNAGMTAFQISLWMQRASLTHLYLHDSRDIADLTRGYMREGRLVGAAVNQYLALPSAAERELQLESLEDAHITSTGLCCKSFLLDRCRRSKACEDDCEYALSIVGDEQPIPELLRKRSQIGLALARIDNEIRAGRSIVSRQRQLCERMLENIDERVAIARKA
jgi:hypothetical protein